MSHIICSSVLCLKWLFTCNSLSKSIAIKYTICLNCCSTLCFIGNTFNLKQLLVIVLAELQFCNTGHCSQACVHMHTVMYINKPLRIINTVKSSQKTSLKTFSSIKELHDEKLGMFCQCSLLLQALDLTELLTHFLYSQHLSKNLT